MVKKREDILEKRPERPLKFADDQMHVRTILDSLILNFL
jgi:hypothetical protein